MQTIKSSVTCILLLQGCTCFPSVLCSYIVLTYSHSNDLTIMFLASFLSSSVISTVIYISAKIMHFCLSPVVEIFLPDRDFSANFCCVNRLIPWH